MRSIGSHWEEKNPNGSVLPYRTSTPAGRLFFHILAAMGQMERELIVERTRAGLEAAKRRGVTMGRKRLMTQGKLESAKQLLQSGMSPRAVARNLGMSLPTLYRWLPASDRNPTQA
jgi:DNA invertase Pin-like site-specific DNA recombinase